MKQGLSYNGIYPDMGKKREKAIVKEIQYD